jgi:hypothetical protein
MIWSRKHCEFIYEVYSIHRLTERLQPHARSAYQDSNDLIPAPKLQCSMGRKGNLMVDGILCGKDWDCECSGADVVLVGFALIGHK